MLAVGFILANFYRTPGERVYLLRVYIQVSCW